MITRISSLDREVVIHMTRLEEVGTGLLQQGQADEKEGLEGGM